MLRSNRTLSSVSATQVLVSFCVCSAIPPPLVSLLRMLESQLWKLQWEGYHRLSKPRSPIDAKLAVCFEQFRHELSYDGGGDSSLEPAHAHPLIVTNDAKLGDLEPHRFLRREIYAGGGHFPCYQWQHQIDFPLFVDGDNPLA